MSKKEKATPKVCNIGGQAVMEGVMMKAPTHIAMAVRGDEGTIVTDVIPYGSKNQKGTFFAWPIVRGVVSFVESLTLGMKTITRSAELYGEDLEDEEPSKLEKWLSEKTGKSIDKIVIGLAVVLAIFLSVGLFFMLPTFLSGLILKNSSAQPVVKALIEGAVRLLIFLGYLFAVRLMKDAKRLFMYHGAEHKVIACYEHDAPLTPESAREFTRFHPRCGTNYMFLVMAVSILFFAIIGFNANFWLRLLTRLIFLPVVAGLSYEVLRFGAKSDSIFARIARAPGIALQRLTTIEPDDKMLEVAIVAFKLALMDKDEAMKLSAEKSAEAEAAKDDNNQMASENEAAASTEEETLAEQVEAEPAGQAENS